MTAPIAAPAVLGMLGGGQLGRYFVGAAHELGYRVWVLDPDPSSPAGRIADRHLIAAYDDGGAIAELAAACAAVTTEFENVPAATLEQLADRTVVHPSAAAVAICQDRIAEKAFLSDSGVPVGPLAVLRDEGDLTAITDEELDALLPGVLKAARLGYDGKAQIRVATRDEVERGFAELGSVPCVLERLLPLDRELSVVLARGVDGSIESFAVAENRHRDGILDISIAPAPIPDALAAEAVELAGRVAVALDYVGTLAVELFVSDGRLLVNELAPRPHNSGHLTLDATVTSQFEQQVRALCRLPLASGHAHSAAVMVNLLGDLWPDEGRTAPRWPSILGDPALKLHLYGKAEARPGRKMGHLTVLAEDLDRALDAAMEARAAVGIVDAGTDS